MSLSWTEQSLAKLTRTDEALVKAAALPPGEAMAMRERADFGKSANVYGSAGALTLIFGSAASYTVGLLKLVDMPEMVSPALFFSGLAIGAVSSKLLDRREGLKQDIARRAHANLLRDYKARSKPTGDVP